jgi:DNA-binding response OmpR family regulator
MRVLIIEDEKGMAELLKKGLEEENHRIALAFDGLEGLELARVYEFDVIVLDLMLPKVDGFEVARRLRHSGNQTPILILTARDAVPDIVKGLDLGADDYLTKPFSFEEFLARLRTVARRGSAPRPILPRAKPSGGAGKSAFLRLSTASWNCSCGARAGWYPAPQLWKPFGASKTTSRRTPWMPSYACSGVK